MKEALSNAQLIIVHNRTQQETLANMGYQSILMAHGVEEHFIKPKETTNHSNHLQVTTIGQLIPQKNIDWVVKAVESYQGQKEIVLRIAGEGPLRKELETLASGNNNIQFLGQISHENIGKLLHQSDIFALPSVNETFGLVYLEAAAHQNAIIASKGTGVWGHYTEEEEMFFCDSYDVFQTQLHKLIDDDALRNKMAEKAFAKTKENFTWDTIIEKYASLYRRLLTKPHSLSNKSFTG